jgi:hypothetical protein
MKKLSKKFMTIGIAVMMSGVCFGQNADEVFYNELFSLFVKDGLLEEVKIDSTASKSKQRKQKEQLKKQEDFRKEIKTNYPVPEQCFNDPPIKKNPKIVNNNYFNQSFERLGSYVIHNGDLSVLNNVHRSTLPVLDNGAQFLYVEGTGFYDYYSSKKVLSELDTKNEINGGFQDYLKVRLYANYTKNAETNNEISFGVGHFQNKLSEIYSTLGRYNTNQITPVFELLKLYWKEEIKLTDSIIDFFNGMCVYSFKSKNTKELSDIGENTNLALNYLNFVNFKTETSLKWNTNKETTENSKGYHVYMFEKPTLYQLPTKADLTKWWNDNKFKEIKRVSETNLLTNNAIELEVKFGPIPAEEYNNVKIDYNYSVRQLIGLPIDSTFIEIGKPHFERYESDGSCVYKVKISRDERKMASIIGEATGNISIPLQLRLFYNNSADSIDVIYKTVDLETELKPYPKIITTTPIRPVLENDKYKYYVEFEFETPSNSEISNRTGNSPTFTNEVSLDNDIQNDLIKQSINNLTRINNANGRYNFTFFIPKENELVGTQEECIVKIKVKFKLTTNATDYYRFLQFNIAKPKPTENQQSVTTASTILIKSLDEFKEKLKTDNIGIRPIKEKYLNNNGDIDWISFIGELRLQKIITPIEGGDIVPVDLIKNLQ